MTAIFICHDMNFKIVIFSFLAFTVFFIYDLIYTDQRRENVKNSEKVAGIFALQRNRL